MLFRRKKENCVICGRELQHKHRPKEEWGIDGFLCGDCHLDKMREYYAEGKEPKKPKCDHCSREVEIGDLYEPRRGLNLKGKVCKECFDGAKAEQEKKFLNCAICGKKLGFIRYHPKSEWNVDGQLCKKCWNEKNMR
jgi:hypothetical protein